MAYRKPDIPKPRKPRAKETRPRKPRLLKHERQAAFLDNFDAVIGLVRDGATFAQAVAQTPGAPCLATFRKMAAASPDHSSRMEDALKARETGMNYRWGRHNALNDAALGAILDAIQREPARHVHDICKELGHSYNAVSSRARRDRAFRTRLDNALAIRAAKRPTNRTGPRPGRVFIRRTQRPDDLLRRGLLNNDMFLRADKIASKVSIDYRDDVRTDAIIAMLEDGYPEGRTDKQFAFDLYRAFKRPHLPSIDVAVRDGDERVHFVDTFTTSNEVHAW
ncbi:MAG: hypothetical protein WBH00_11670 [Xanthobacteraceae bacterium]